MEGSAGVEAREKLGRELYAINAPQFASEGLNFGYAYQQSPIIQYDGESAPAYDMGSATPSTVPGCRLPHFWLGADQSVYDLLGDGYTLLQVGETNQSQDISRLQDSFAHFGMPLKHLQVPEQAPPYCHSLLLVRPDQHIAWRGDLAPIDSTQLAAKLTGRGDNQPPQ
jgi:hypothetical protein